MKSLNISLSFTEIENLTRWKFKKIVKEKTTLAAFAYLLEQKTKPNVKIPTYQWFYSKSVSAMIFCAKIMMERLKVRKDKIENG